MKKITLLIFIVALFGMQLVAEPWVVTGNANMNLSQNYYSNNWKGEEISSLTWILSLNFTANKQLSPIMLNENTLTLSFGQTHKYDKLTEKWFKSEKSTDLINALSLLKFTLDSYVDPFVGLKIETHFYDNLGAFHPMIITESFGVSRDFLTDDAFKLSSRLGGAFKEAFVGEADMVTSGGVEFVTSLQKKIFKDAALYTSNLNIYKAMFYSESDTANDDWKTPDVNWENILAFNLSKYVAFQIYTQLIYDKQVDVKGQFKENISLSLNYNLF